MRRPIVVPNVGYPAPTMSVWYVRPGERISAGDRIVELLLGAATFDVPSPCTGYFVEKTAWPPDRVAVGDVVGWIEVEADA
jgi:pyruvate/2-oxoglutarate dehydrogenase complex dihydrolipoamide acyltransferase (E2) component